MSSKWSPSFRFPDKHPACIYHLPSYVPHAHKSILLELITWITLDEKYKSWSFSIQFSLVSFPNIFLTALFSHTFNVCFSLNVRAKVSCPYIRPGKIIALYILIFLFLDNQWEGQGKLVFYVRDSRPKLTWILNSITDCIGVINYRSCWEGWTQTWKWLCLITLL